jgi:hypothetical protein
MIILDSINAIVLRGNKIEVILDAGNVEILGADDAIAFIKHLRDRQYCTSDQAESYLKHLRLFDSNRFKKSTADSPLIKLAKEAMKEPISPDEKF